MTPEEIGRLVEHLGAARLAGLPVTEATSLIKSADGEEGYRVQAELAAWLSDRGQGAHTGYKIGATTKSMQQALGVAGPVYGNILSENILRSGDTFACNPDCRPGVECEIAFRLGEDFPSSAAPFTREGVMGRIDAVIPAVEIVENRYGDFRSCAIALLTADDFFHKACVLGDPVADWRGLDLPGVLGRTSINGSQVETGTGREVLGHPLDAIVWLANQLANRNIPLKAGQIVMTGSMTPVHWIEDLPSDAEIHISGLGASSVSLTTFPS